MTKVNKADLAAVQQKTLRAAEQALDLKLLTPEQFNRMTDGRVSTVDVDVANRVVDEQTGAEAGPSDQFMAGLTARNLQVSVLEQAEAQGFFTSMWESLKDLRNGAAE